MADALRTTIGSPLPVGSQVGTLTFSNFVLNQSTDALEIIFQVDEAVTITSLGFRYGARALTPPTYRISLQGVDGSGNPDGIIKGATNNCLATFLPPADTSINGLWQWKVTTESYTAARGEWLAIVIAYSSGTIDATNNSSFTSIYGGTGGTRAGPPYAIHNDNDVRTRQTNTGYPAFGYKTASATYGLVIQSFTTTAYASNSTPDERALKFTLPAAWAATKQVVGIMVYGGAGAIAKTLLITLYDGTTALQTFTWDTDIAPTTGLIAAIIYFDEATLSTLTYGSTYRVGVAPQETTASCSIAVATNAAATDWQGWPGGESFALSTRTDLGAWTDDALSRPCIDLILKDITEPAGGGGMLVHPGMAGGLRG